MIALNFRFLPFLCILGWVDVGSDLLYLILHYYFTLLYLLGAVYVTHLFHRGTLHFATLYDT